MQILSTVEFPNHTVAPEIASKSGSSFDPFTESRQHATGPRRSNRIVPADTNKDTGAAPKPGMACLDEQNNALRCGVTKTRFPAGRMWQQPDVETPESR